MHVSQAMWLAYPWGHREKYSIKYYLLIFLKSVKWYIGYQVNKNDL